jgi:hypothetical protein
MLGMRVLLLALALALGACQTSYQPFSTGGIFNVRGGWAHHRLDTNSFQVVFTGNRYTPVEKVQASLLYHAAEVAVANGANYFTIRDGPGAIWPHNVVIPGATVHVRHVLESWPPQASLLGQSHRVQAIIDTSVEPPAAPTEFTFHAASLARQLRPYIDP